MTWELTYTRPDYKGRAITLVQEAEFDVTSTDYRWRGKVTCRWCNRTGYAGDVKTNSLWWGQYHGINCKNRS